MASSNSNKGRAVVLSAACVTMFFISSIALYSVVSKNLLAVYPEWSSALAWAFPVFQTIMAVTGIFAGRISDKIGPRNVVIAAAVCYGLGWFMSGTVTEPWIARQMIRRLRLPCRVCAYMRARTALPAFAMWLS